MGQETLNLLQIKRKVKKGMRGRDSSVAVATRYGLDGPGIESRCGRDFPHPSRRPLGPPNLLQNGYRVSFPEIMRPGRGVNHPSLSSTQVKERVEIYLYLPQKKFLLRDSECCHRQIIYVSQRAALAAMSVPRRMQGRALSLQWRRRVCRLPSGR
jgi:hypothetical protein